MLEDYKDDQFWLMKDMILSKYIAGETSLRDVAIACGTNHHTVKRVLISNGVKIEPAKRRPFTQSHKDNISKATKGRVSWIKGKKANAEMLYKNMASHIRFDVDWVWLSQFDDFDKLKLLNDVITNRSGRWDVSTEWYKTYMEKFYNDDQFNSIYTTWINGGKVKYKKPSLDHITPKSKGGTNSLDNLQFLTWFENRCKNDMTQTEWDNLKLTIEEYFV